jgi:long-chain-fatty-acid--[acyl-carrier-protein] ligase
MGLKHVVTSKAFMNRLAINVPGTSFFYLEDARQSVGRLELLRTLLRIRYLPDGIRSGVPKPDPNEPAVVLFTSGSEKAPKAVPLTHRNLILNQRSGTQVLKPRSEDAIFGFLPAFHSFGTSITGLYPLLTGIRVVRHPDPTDAAALARKIGLYKPTILVSTPTFVSYILERAQPGELRSLRMVVLGAEKCPKAVFERFAEASPDAVILEGYGITECSPVVSVNPPEANRPGTVGIPLGGVELSVRSFETDGEKISEIGSQLPTGSMGMLLVSGPTVFPGYLAYEGEPPFREIDGKRWYVTGDLAAVDQDGYVHFSGRLKRFVKAGGEMISLVALEVPFQEMFPPTKKEGVRAMVEGVEVDGGRARLVLFTTEPITLREANEVLSKAGYTGLMRLDEVRRVDKIPVGGTGKPDWKLLRSQVLQPQQQSA